MRAEIVSVGTELLLGHITDTNASYLAEQLSALGIDCYWISQLGDNLERLTDHLRRAWNRSDLTVITGGIGPTEDDLTREAISAVLDEPMVVQADLETELRGFFARRGVEMPERNVKQATLIRSAQVLSNPVGTAPGWWVERDGRVIVAMPGVPSEMYRMWGNEVLPHLAQQQGGSIILTRILKVLGLGESTVEEMIHPLLGSTNPTIATYAKQDGIHVRVTAKAQDQSSATKMLDEFEPSVRTILGEFIYGVDGEALADVVAGLLAASGLSIAIAEDYTGGLISEELSQAAGDHFRGGTVLPLASTPGAMGPLDEQAADLLAQKRARELAVGAIKQWDAELGLAVTAVDMQLSEGRRGKRLAIALGRDGTWDEHQRVETTTPATVRRRAVLYALNLVREALQPQS
ncbi:MAG: competence/damage-inducible protein A [Dehalococcoidia bacterium]|nr:competence/damage-inducible protein A [Dehalococcoidia bacterium]